jgi:hypothetical protein
MSDERDPDRTDGRHPDEPRDAGSDDAVEARPEARPEAEASSPYGPVDPGATDGPDVDVDDVPAPPAPPVGYSAAGGYGPPAGGSGSAAFAPPGPAAPGTPSSGYPAPDGHASAAGYAPPTGTPPYAGGPPPRPRGGKGVAIAALVVGIVAVIGAVIPFLNYVAFVPAFAAIILGIVSLARRMDGKPLALTGLILGVVAFVLSIVLAIAYTLAFVSAVSGAVESSDGSGVFPSAGPTSGGTDPYADGDATGAPGTSPEDPLPIGTTVTGEGVDGPEWSVTLGQPIVDATAAVLAADPTNPEPAEGMQYAVVPVTVTYLGDDEGDPLSELALGYLAPDGSQHSAADAFALAPAPAFTDNAEMLESQGTASGNVVIEIPTEGAGEGLWATAPGLTADAYYFRAG